LDIPVQEIFFIEKGKLRVTLYEGNQQYKDVIVSDGQIILLNCGHSVKFLEDTRMAEVKQGPYREKEFEKIPLE
jgi:mannose-6-phosphate isomerase-like protein (cupin superfamily)